ncbi:lecithin retinol acyltransferase family protein [Neptuniibacter sp. QD37_11]|uniref:lecithin retinol acyltransferase family protein n=1 Tax=Neptuniibacter sp. QD37_11 TaxID=3398209 RepID=UPI0039F53A55
MAKKKKGNKGFAKMDSVAKATDAIACNKAHGKDSSFGIKIGSHLWVKRKGYTHHGIYIGNKLVIHYSGLADGLQSGPVETVSLREFAGGSEINLRAYKEPKYKPNEVVQRAKSRLGEDLYSVHANNCEHFCCWAITGKHESKQVDFAQDLIGAFTPAGKAVLDIRTLIRAWRTGDKEALNSASKKAGKSVMKTAIVSAALRTAAGPYALPVMAAGWAGKELYKRIKDKDPESIKAT